MKQKKIINVLDHIYADISTEFTDDMEDMMLDVGPNNLWDKYEELGDGLLYEYVKATYKIFEVDSGRQLTLNFEDVAKDLYELALSALLSCMFINAKYNVKIEGRVHDGST